MSNRKIKTVENFCSLHNITPNFESKFNYNFCELNYIEELIKENKSELYKILGENE